MAEAQKQSDSIVGLPGINAEDVINLERSPCKSDNVAVLNHKCSKPEGYWKYNLDDLLLLPATGGVEDTVRAWSDYSLLNANVAHHFIKDTGKIPEAWKPYTIYFLGTVFVEKPWSEFVHIMFWDKVNANWQLSNQPLKSGLKAGARIIVFK